jgi:hypothetical protein
MKSITALTALLVVVSVSSVVDAGPIKNLVAVQDFPDVIVAGSGYQTHYRFDNAADEEVSLAFMLNLTNPDHPVNAGEFFVSMNLESHELGCMENEPGSFVCDDEGEEVTIEPESTNDLFVNTSSVPPLYPDNNYTITLDIVTENPVVFPDILFASGQGQASDGGKRIVGQSMIYSDESGENFKLWVKDRRSGREFSRVYSLVRYFSGWFWEVYQCRDDTGRNFTITVIFRYWVRGHGRNIFFFGRLM